MKCDHELTWIDDSFDHALGTERRGHWECSLCDDQDIDLPPPEYDPQPDDVF